MTTEIFGSRRIEPLHGAEVSRHAAEDTVQTNDLKQDAGDDLAAQVHAVAAEADYTISVDQVREHFRTKGVSKSKDTVQRWCRNGELDCQKRGVLGRYFTTETSLLKLDQKLLPDMIAEQTGQVLSDAAANQQDAAAHAAEINGTQVRAPEDEVARTGTQVNEVEDAAARSNMSEPTAAGALAEELAALRAENSGLKEQLADAKDTAAFLREEIVSARGQRGDVVKIAEQMLGTLETMAVGGRLEKPTRSAAQPVRFQTDELGADRV